MYDLFAALDRRPCWQTPLLKSSPWQRIPVGDCACLGLVCAHYTWCYLMEVSGSASLLATATA